MKNGKFETKREDKNGRMKKNIWNKKNETLQKRKNKNGD